MKVHPFYLVFICCITVVSSSTASPIDLLPRDNEIAGWIGDTNSGCVEGIANDTDDLYLFIDGPGYDYIILGWIRGAFKGYIDTVNITADDTVATCIEIYDQATRQNALALFDTMGVVGVEYEILQNLGDTARMDTNLVSTFIEMTSKSYFIRLTTFSKNPMYKQVLINFATYIDQKITTPILFTNSKSPLRNLCFSIIPVAGRVIFRIKSSSFLKGNPEISDILLYNLRGTFINRITVKEVNNSNERTVIWYGYNYRGLRVSAGTYFAVVHLKNGFYSKKFVLP